MRPGGLEPLARHKSAPWYAELRSELLKLPAGKHDDHVDALGLIGHGLALVVVVAADLTETGLTKDVLANKGDAYCIWAHSKIARPDQLRGNPNRFSRRHLITGNESDRIRTSTFYRVRIYNEDGGLIENESGPVQIARDVGRR